MVFLHYTQAISYARLVSVMREVFTVTISQGAIANMLKRARPRFLSEAATITETVKSSVVICSDETSARVEGRTWWEWVFIGERAVLRHIVPSRAKAVVTEVMAGASPEVWVSDLYAAQQGHARDWQVCLAHQLRDVQYAIDDGDPIFSARLKWLLRAGLRSGDDDPPSRTVRSGNTPTTWSAASFGPWPWCRAARPERRSNAA